MTKKLGRPRVRPRPTDPGLLARIVDGLTQGNSMKAVCEDQDMPRAADVYSEMAKNVEFRTAIARAREAQQEAIIDEMVDMADAATPENWQVVKMRIWARQWRAAKLAPKKYGDKQDISVSGQVDIAATILAARKRSGIA